MCKHPIRIINRTKYLNNHSGMPYYVWVNCGHCSECRYQKQMEWNLRTYYQVKDCIDKEGMCYFDTLTYRNEDLPRLAKYNSEFKNYPCFDYRHIREFYEKLRQKLKLNKDSDIKYFIVSEYGDIRKRPHYHIILFVYSNIEVEKLSKTVSDSWKYGRTDGLPYKNLKYVKEHNVITKINLDVIRYVAKYVSKQQTFIDIINKRWQALEKYYNKSKFDKLTIKRIKAQYFRLTTPFHRQSQHFGETALYYANWKDLFENNRLYYKDDSLKINQFCSLPMYYKRKLTQEQIKYKGKRIWINSEDGAAWRQEQEAKIIDKLTTRLSDLNKNLGKAYKLTTLQQLASYIIKQRGRLNGNYDYLPHHLEAEMYNYNTDKDDKYIGKGIYRNWHGNDKVGYCQFKDEIITDIEKSVYMNEDYERIITDLQVEKDDKSLVLLKEHLAEIKKVYFKR